MKRYFMDETSGDAGNCAWMAEEGPDTGPVPERFYRAEEVEELVGRLLPLAEASVARLPGYDETIRHTRELLGKA